MKTFETTTTVEPTGCPRTLSFHATPRTSRSSSRPWSPPAIISSREKRLARRSASRANPHRDRGPGQACLAGRSPSHDYAAASNVSRNAVMLDQPPASEAYLAAVSAMSNPHPSLTLPVKERGPEESKGVLRRSLIPSSCMSFIGLG